jgi:hypothetical protein
VNSKVTKVKRSYRFTDDPRIAYDHCLQSVRMKMSNRCFENRIDRHSADILPVAVVVVWR